MKIVRFGHEGRVRYGALEGDRIEPLEGAVATRNSKYADKSGVFEFVDAISPTCLFSCDRSFLGLYADSVVGR